jgi:hypothetical protein
MQTREAFLDHVLSDVEDLAVRFCTFQNSPVPQLAARNRATPESPDSLASSEFTTFIKSTHAHLTDRTASLTTRAEPATLPAAAD